MDQKGESLQYPVAGGVILFKKKSQVSFEIFSELGYAPF